MEKSLYKWSRSHDQDGRYAQKCCHFGFQICKMTHQILLHSKQKLDIEHNKDYFSNLKSIIDLLSYIKYGKCHHVSFSVCL